jgi:hypothetical protein
LQTHVRHSRLNLHDDLGDARLDLFELRFRLVDGRLECRRRSGSKYGSQHQPIRFSRLDELAERRLALGDSQLVGRRRKHLLGALKLVERFGEVPLALQLVALLEEVACGRSLGIADLPECGRRPEDQTKTEYDGKGDGTHKRSGDQYPGSAAPGEDCLGAGGFTDDAPLAGPGSGFAGPFGSVKCPGERPADVGVVVVPGACTRIGTGTGSVVDTRAAAGAAAAAAAAADAGANADADADADAGAAADDGAAADGGAIPVARSSDTRLGPRATLTTAVTPIPPTTIATKAKPSSAPRDARAGGAEAVIAADVMAAGRPFSRPPAVERPVGPSRLNCVSGKPSPAS